MNIQVPPCKNCGAALKELRTKGTYGCPNWKKDGSGCEGDYFDSNNFQPRKYPKPRNSFPEPQNQPYNTSETKTGDALLQQLVEANTKCLKAVSELVVEIKKFIGQN